VNLILKYVDDFNLLIPENSNASAGDEMKHIVSWSESNKLYINFTKCRELVFCRPSLKSDSLPYALPNIVRVICDRFL